MDIALPRARAADGCRIRILIEDPHDLIEPLLDVDAIEIRASPAGVDHILYRADDQILLALRQISFPERSPPLIHLRQVNYGGPFDRLVDDCDDRWDKATPLASSVQPRAYLDDTEVEPGSGPAQLPEPDSPSPPPSRRSETPTDSPGEAPRRWPGRPSCPSSDQRGHNPQGALSQLGAIVARAAGPSRSGLRPRLRRPLTRLS